jgi:hypothetical protein
VCIHIYTYTYITFMYECVYPYTHTHTHTCVCVCVCINIYPHTHTHTHTHTHLHIQVHICMEVYNIYLYTSSPEAIPRTGGSRARARAILPKSCPPPVQKQEGKGSKTVARRKDFRLADARLIKRSNERGRVRAKSRMSGT